VAGYDSNLKLQVLLGQQEEEEVVIGEAEAKAHPSDRNHPLLTAAVLQHSLVVVRQTVEAGVLVDVYLTENNGMMRKTTTAIIGSLGAVSPSGRKVNGSSRAVGVVVVVVVVVDVVVVVVIVVVVVAVVVLLLEVMLPGNTLMYFL